MNVSHLLETNLNGESWKVNIDAGHLGLTATSLCDAVCIEGPLLYQTVTSWERKDVPNDHTYPCHLREFQKAEKGKGCGAKGPNPSLLAKSNPLYVQVYDTPKGRGTYNIQS